MRAIGILVALAGCTVGPDFRPPVVTSPAGYNAEPRDVPFGTNQGAIDPAWWDSFRDAELSSLVTRLADQNIDLKSAAERVNQGLAQRRVAESRGLPHLDATADYRRMHASENGTLRLVTPAPGAPFEYDVFQDAIQASWELDLFGRVRRAVEAAEADTEAATEARHAVALAAIAELAQDYMRLRGTQAQTAIVAHDIQLADENAKLARDRFANGVGTTLDVDQADAQRASLAAMLPSLRATESELINAIGSLLALPPRALEAELRPPAAQPPVPPSVPIGLPSELARRRPDLREAEARLHAATAETGVAVADFYPDISLTGSFGFQALRTGDLFTLASRQASVGPSIDLPIFRGGELRGTLHLRESQQREAALDYQQTVLRAWQDVDNALTAYAETQHRRAELATAVAKNSDALGAARQRYREGVIDFLNVISVQSSLDQSESALAEADMQIGIALVGLYKALGGGWGIADAPPP